MGTGTTDSLRVRDLPSVEYGDTVGRINRGEKVAVDFCSGFTDTIDEIESEWYHITGFLSGWVFGGYIQLSERKYVPVFHGDYNLDKNRIRNHYSAIAQECINNKQLPVSVFSALKIPPLGYVFIGGIYFWIDNNNIIYAFNGKKVYNFLNIRFLNELRGANYYILKYSENCIYIKEGAAGGFRVSFLDTSGFIFDMAAGSIRKDIPRDKSFTLNSIDKTMPGINSLFPSLEGFRAVVNNKLFGKFIETETVHSVYVYENGAAKRIAELPQEYIDHSIRSFPSEETILFVYPEKGWEDEDTRGPYIFTVYNFVTKKVINQYKRNTL
jgi:hypothetical protein